MSSRDNFEIQEFVCDNFEVEAECRHCRRVSSLENPAVIYPRVGLLEAQTHDMPDNCQARLPS